MGKSISKNNRTATNNSGNQTAESDDDFSTARELEREERPLSATDRQALEVDISKYNFDIENLTLEGGGGKGYAYCGALQVLEEVGLTVSSGRIKRLAGTSSGAMTAMLLAIGYTSSDIQGFLALDLEEFFKDSRFGFLSFLPNLMSIYGWNPGKKIFDWFGEKIEEKTGNADTTFSELYALKSIELCIVTTNINQMNVLYCHPKTTPDMPVRTAVRMSMGFPVVFAPVTYRFHQTDNMFVDGGLICNFPIHTYDGWWLSMKKEDSFFTHICGVENLHSILQRDCRFGTYNPKTIGMMLYADDDEDLYKYKLQKRIGTKLYLDDIPDTKLGKEYKKVAKEERYHRAKYTDLVNAVNSLMKVLSKHDVDESQTISLDEFKAVLNDADLSDEDKQKLFGENYNVDDVYNSIDRKKNEINFQDLIVYFEKLGLEIHDKMLGYKPTEIDSFGSFISSIQSTLSKNIGRLYMKLPDVRRTIGINTGHIGTTDMDFEREDKEFLIHRGRVSAEAFFKYFVVWNNLNPVR